MTAFQKQMLENVAVIEARLGFAFCDATRLTMAGLFAPGIEKHAYKPLARIGDAVVNLLAAQAGYPTSVPNAVLAPVYRTMVRGLVWR